MARTRLSEKEHYEFCYPVTLQPRDINYSGHMGVDSLVTIIGSARAYIFKSIGLSELNLGEKRIGIIMTDLVMDMRAEGFMFDKLEILTHVGELTRNGFRFFHRVIRNGSLIALAETGVLVFNYAERKVARVPDSLIRALELSAT
jgi:acyl-CoA thioester hydrolase